MSFNDELAKSSFQMNIVLKIGDNYYSQYQVDSGLTIDSDKLGLVFKVSVNGSSVDLKRVKTSISTLNFTLLDKNGSISNAIGLTDNAWIGDSVDFYLGFITGSFAWSDYKHISSTYIDSYSKVENAYSFKSLDPMSLIQQPIYTTRAQVNNDLLSTDTSEDFVGLDIADFPSSGMMIMDDEFISYTSKTLVGGSPVAYTLGGMTRGEMSGEAVDHDEGTVAYMVTHLSDNPINLLKDILTSELSIDSSIVDTTTMDSIRDTYFSGETFSFYVWNIDNALDWIEENILKATNCRLIIKDGKISLAILDKIDYTIEEVEINEDHIQKQPSYSIDGNKVINKVIVRFEYDYTQKKYLEEVEYTDTSSISDYGEKRPFVLELKGVTSANGGSDIASDRANRMLLRFAYPSAEIKVTTHFNRFNINIGDDVRLKYRYLPQSGAGLGIDDLLEVISKAPSGFDSNAKINWTLAFTSFSGIRIGLIAPAQAPASVTSQKVFTMPSGYGDYYRAGYFLKLWDNVNNTYFSDSANEIESVSGDTITMKSSFTTTLGSNTTIKFADYDECSDEQILRYAFVAPTSGIFADDKKAYGIVF